MIWSTAPVTQQPEISFIRWCVMEVEKNGEVDRHLVGYCPENYEGRVSTAIKVIDYETRRVRTSSGRVYQLVGPPRHDPDGMYVWGRWSRAYKVEGKDVSEEVAAMLKPIPLHQGGVCNPYCDYLSDKTCNLLNQELQLVDGCGWRVAACVKQE